MDYYHVYNRGAHKAPIFNDSGDYWRFLDLLYIANSEKPFLLEYFNGMNIFSVDRIKRLVEIVAYCLMPNHFHIVLKGNDGGGITKFMRKLCTGYVMYYNSKNDHSGTIFQGKYKSKLVADENYFKTLIDYVHLNPYGIEEPDMTKDARMEHLKDAWEYSKKYEYSSLKDYLGENRIQKTILREVRPTGGPTSQN